MLAAFLLFLAQPVVGLVLVGLFLVEFFLASFGQHLNRRPGLALVLPVLVLPVLAWRVLDLPGLGLQVWPMRLQQPQELANPECVSTRAERHWREQEIENLLAENSNR